MTRLILAALTLLAAPLVAGCGSGEAPIGELVDFEPAPPQDLVELGIPQTPAGRFVLYRDDHVRLELEPSLDDAIARTAACASWITQCVEPGARELDDCVRSSAAACPAACYERYAARRREGAAPIDALEHALFEATCVPGLAELVGGGA